MLKNYLTSALRSLKRYKLFTFLNVIGLSTGMACSIIILLWVKDERSYDKFNQNASSIYRLICKVSDVDAAVTPPPVVPTLKQQMPAIAAVTRVVPLTATITIAGQKFDEKNILYADSNFLDLFNYPLLHGDKATVLSKPNGILVNGCDLVGEGPKSANSISSYWS